MLKKGHDWDLESFIASDETFAEMLCKGCPYWRKMEYHPSGWYECPIGDYTIEDCYRNDVYKDVVSILKKAEEDINELIA